MTHGVFLCNSNGMDVKIRSESSPKGDRQTSLEYNIIGGILDFYFFAGDGEYGEGDPMAVAREYSDIIGTPAMTPYWNLGVVPSFNPCRTRT